MRKLKLFMAACALVAGSVSASAQIASGTTYYLQNKASGRFISSGHAWFTRSTLSPVLDYPIQLNSSGDGYILKVIGSNQLGHNLFVDNGSNNVWKVTAVAGEEKVYTIANGTNYLGSDGSFVLSGSLTDATSDAAKWYIRSKDDYLAMFTSASAENPVDASFYITGPSYDYTDTNRDNKWTMTGFGAGTELTRGSGTTAINPYVVERYNGTGSIKQTLTGLKKGMYGVSVYGFYRAGDNNTATASRTAGTEAQNAIMYAGNKEKPLKSIYDDAQSSAVSGSFDTNTSLGYVPNARSTAGECFANGYYKNTIYVYIENDETELEIGVKKDATIGSDWAIIDNWSMTYYGSEELTETEIVLAASVKTYNEALAAAQAYQSVDMFDEDKTALNTAINDNTIDLSGTVTEAQLIEAAANLNAAAEAAATAVNKYTTYNTANTLINGGSNIDLTSLIANPSFENNFVGWTNNGLAAQGNNSFGKTGNIYAEKWEPKGTFGVSQTIGALPAGLYQLTADIKARSVTSARVYAAGIDQTVTIADEQNTYTVNFALDDKSEALIGFEGTGTGAGSSWLCVDNFTLKYVGALPDELTAVTGNMNATVAAAQTSAINAYNSNKTVANYNAAQAAIAAAQASKDAYAKMTPAITKIDAALTAATSATESDDDYQAIKTAYTNGTIADADIQSNIINAYKAVIPVIKSQTATSADFTLAIQNQSFEYGDMTGWTANASSDTGVRDATNATYAANGSDGYYLFNTWWQGVPLTQTVESLPNGQYTLTASVASDGATIYLIANGEHNEGTETGGEHPTSDTFQDAAFTFLVKDGTAVIGVVGGADGTAGEHKDYVEEGYWWYKADNFRLVKNRDLTQEEEAVAPADLALDATTTIYKGKNTTLTPTSTTEDASIAGYVNWSSDDTNIATVDANGVVTGVAYGTANITATSSLNEEATATCAVTVTAPLITEAENLDFAEGPVIDNHICTYAADMTKPENNTTFSRTQPVNGWTIVSTDADGKAAGVMAYGSSTGMGNNSVFAPIITPDGEATGNVLGMVGVWTGSVQYVQNVKLPAGAYTITVPIYRNGGSSALTKNLIGVILDDGTEHLAKTTTYADSWTTETVKFTVAEETYGKLSLGLNAPNKGSNDSQRLWIDGMNITYEPFATSEEIAALNKAIETAEGYTLGFDESEYAPYVNANALTALAAAKELDTENPIAQSDVTDATAALSGAVWTANTEEVNAFFDGAFAGTYSHDGNVMPTGWHGVGEKDDAYNVRLMWDYTNNPGLNATTSKQAAFLKYTGIYGNEAGYTLPLKEGLYQLKFIYGGWNEVGTRNIKIYNGDNEATVTPSNVTALDNKAHTTESSWSTFKGYVEIPADGDYIFSFYRQSTDSQNQFVFSDIELKKAVAEDVTIEETADYTPAEKYANVTFNRTLVQGWNGMVLPFDMSVDDVKATFKASKVKDFKSVTVTDGKATLDFEDATDVQAGKPFMMKADEAGTSYTINGVLLPAAGLQPVSKESGDVKYTFTGSYAATTDLSSVVFALIQGDQYFYHNTGKPSSAKAFRAWFVNESTDEAGSRISFNFGDDVITGINEVLTNGQDAEAVYNLQGQRVVNAKKGLFIQNGKKVVIK